MDDFNKLRREAEIINRNVLRDYSYTEKMIILEMIRQALLYAKFKSLMKVKQEDD